MTGEQKKVQKNITLDETICDAIDERRGLVPFSTFLNDLLRKDLDLNA